MSKPYMGAETKGIGQLIQERESLRVPDHQRDYTWPVGAVEQYLLDINAAMEKIAPHYFIGLVVLVESDDNSGWQILDGQQRLATTIMIYAAMRTWLAGNGFPEDASLIQQKYIGVAELGEKQHRPRLRLNVNNNEVFEELVVEQVSDEQLDKRRKDFGRHSSNRRLAESAMACRKSVSDLARAGGTEPKRQAAKLYDLAKYLRESVQLVCMDVSSTDNAYVIFEALNDRGVDLSVLDLVKNYIFSKAGKRLPEVQSGWTRMVTSLGDRKADDFLKAFWTSRFGRIQKGSLFREISKKYSDPPQVVTLSQDLRKDVELYSAYDVSDSEVWAEHNEATRESIRTLSMLGGTQTQPIVMAALRKFDANDMEKLLRYLICLIVRYQLIGGGRTGRLEQICVRVAPAITSGTLKSPAATWKEILPIVPQDEEFKQDFQNYSETKPMRARYLLSELEITKRKTLNPSKKPELGPIKSGDLILEHIYPKNPSQEWKKVDGFDADSLNRLGNFCLLQESLSKSLGSKAFSKKVESYRASELLLTQSLAAYDNWTKDAIDKRQQGLADLAVLAWPRPAQPSAVR